MVPQSRFRVSYFITKQLLFVIGIGGMASFHLNGCRERSTANLEAKNMAADATFRGKGSFNIWDYDQGPLDRSLINLHADIPYFPGLSKAIYGDQFFRPAFGPIPWRMMPEPNSVKILFIGQDGTHIAEAAGRPATAGFGGRAQDLAEYFGVSSSAAFINTYAFTIKWQYGVFDAPIISNGPNGKKTIRYSAFVPNQVWLMSQDQDSSLTQWRNNLIEWIITNNKDSLRMIVLFGGAARDAMGAFVESRGGKVGARFSVDQIKKNNAQVAEFGLVSAGGNQQASIMLDTNGNAMYKPEGAEAFKAQFDANPDNFVGKIAMPKGGNADRGLAGTGIIHEAQLGGYDIDKQMFIRGNKPTISLSGLKLRSGVVVGEDKNGKKWDVLVTQLPHPTRLSMMKPDEAAAAVAKGLEQFKNYPNWTIPADKFFKTKYPGKFEYGRGDMGPEYYDFGAPKSRMVNVSSASRASADTIVFGTRDRVRFNTAKLAEMREGKPSTRPPDDEMWISKASNINRRYIFDPGPPIDVAQFIKKNLPTDPAFLKAREVNGDYAHYRGTWRNPAVVVFADPHGEDDLITARALTGSRGQYLHSMISSLKIGATQVGDSYLVLKTVPYAAKETNPELWNESVNATKAYRKALFSAVFQGTKPALILLDGDLAAAEFKALQPALAANAVVISRGQGAPDAGITEALNAIKTKGITGQFSGKMTDIPRSHLSYYARVWEGTSGDRVITADGDAHGKAFAEVAPRWAYSQQFRMKNEDIRSCQILRAKLIKYQLRLNFAESIPDYLRRQPNAQVPDTCAASVNAANDPDGASGINDPEDWTQDGHLMIQPNGDTDHGPEQHVPDEPFGTDLHLDIE